MQFPPLTLLLQDSHDILGEVVEALTSPGGDIAHVVVVLNEDWAIEAVSKVRIIPMDEIKKRKMVYAIIPKKSCDQKLIFDAVNKIVGKYYDLPIVLTHFTKEWFNLGIDVKDKYDCVEVAKFMIKECFGPTNLFNDFSAPADLLNMDGKEGWTVRKLIEKK